MKYLTLLLLSILAFGARLFAVLRYESVIHEFDPYFNFRATTHLIENGFSSFYNWFDDKVWYPLGRTVGFTVYPGLMWTAGIVYKTLHSLHLFVDIRNVCVFLAPLFAVFTVFITYFIGKELKDEKAGLLAATFVSVVPGYISRSVAGSFDNECVSIFALLFVYYMWMKSVKTGSLFWSGMASLAYFYMAACWGAYIFVINLIPIHVIVLIVCGFYTHRLFVSYSTFYILGVLMSMQVRFIGFQPVEQSEQMLSLGTFVFLLAFGLRKYLKENLTAEQYSTLIRRVVIGVLSIGGLGLSYIVITGKIAPWTGRFYALLDPTYAKNHIPIIASVSEHQPTTWASYFFDLNFLMFLFPIGLFYLFKNLEDYRIFIILYGLSSVYFASVMVRLMLVLAPIMAIIGGYGMSFMLDKHFTVLNTEPSKKSKKDKNTDFSLSTKKTISAVFIGILLILTGFYMVHCLWATSEAYSSPSIVLAARGQDGSNIIFDDFREAYSWIAHNTAEDARIMSWWDYGYQITAMANRTTIVDNNTWNNTHIATVGRAMSSNEDQGYKIARDLDANYVLVVFGGLTGYASDDINKFLWMVRIGSLDLLDSLYDPIKETDYYTEKGEFSIGANGSPTMLNSLMYKLCYYRFGEVMTDYNSPTGFDRVRRVEIGNKDFDLNYFEEVYTSLHWIVRVYKVKEPSNRD
eukprot:TRINITY_DN2383_c0_g1_i1.p1 TRINITY_DN2383_c0_g1~~TRINITY_DN2383_c0_g1_i1.p1  ORF type:complete len:689 (+),score=147.92 TRINITY_DN2383_c0_g1_i1:1510-3576(+)